MGGFLLTLLLNMAFRFEWAVAALFFYVMHVLLSWPLSLVFLMLVLWVAHSLLVTLLVSWGGRCSEQKQPVRENKNPYSAKTRDFLPGGKNDPS